MSGAKQQQIYKKFLPFLIGGTSGVVATTFIQPLDTIKVQIQIISEQHGKLNDIKKIYIWKVLQKIYKEKGLKIFYRGLESAIWRQLSYGSVRLGSYNSIIGSLQKKGRHISLFERSILSMFCGILGAFVGNPFDVILTRRQATVTTGAKPYANSYRAFQSIIHNQGNFGLWVGIRITILRVLLINFGQLAAHDIITHYLRPSLKDYPRLVDNSSALIASFLTSFISLPADNIKVKLQKQDKKSLQYTGIWNCAKTTIKRQGFFRLWVGFPIYLLRGAPHSFILIRTQQFLYRKLDPQREH